MDRVREQLANIRDYVPDTAAQKDQLIEYLQRERMLWSQHQLQEIVGMPPKAMRSFIDFLIGETHTTMWGRYDWATEMDESVERHEPGFHDAVAAASAANTDVSAAPDDFGGYKLLAKRDLPAGTTIPYVGKAISKQEGEALGQQYVKQIAHNDPKKVWVGDVYPRNNMNMGGFANDLDIETAQEIAPGRGNKTINVTRYRELDESRNNAKLQHLAHRGAAEVLLLQDVRRGEEIGIRYGGDYWRVGRELQKKGQK